MIGYNLAFYVYCFVLLSLGAKAWSMICVYHFQVTFTTGPDKEIIESKIVIIFVYPSIKHVLRCSREPSPHNICFGCEIPLHTLIWKPGPKVIKPFPCSTQLSTKFILLINVKTPIIVGILTFIIKINTTSET